MIYKAFLNGQEIDGFSVGGEEIKEIWGGDTLLWKKDSDILPMKEICSARATYYWTGDTSTEYTRFHEVELSVRNQTEDGYKYITDNTKAGIYLEPNNSSSGIWSTYSYRAYILFDGHINPENVANDSIRNVKETHKIYDMDGNLLETRESWYFSRIYNNDVKDIYQIGSGNGWSLALNPFPIEVHTSGSGEFSSYDELKKYFGVS